MNNYIIYFEMFVTSFMRLNAISNLNRSQTVIDGDARVYIKGDPRIRFLRKKRKKRQGRIFSIFSLVRFKNSVCNPSGTKNTYTGTCYLPTECSEKVFI